MRRLDGHTSQALLTLLAAWVVHDTTGKLELKQGLPLLNQAVAWLILGASRTLQQGLCPARAHAGGAHGRAAHATVGVAGRAA